MQCHCGSGKEGPLRHCRPVCGLYPEGPSRCSEGLRSCRYGLQAKRIVEEYGERTETPEQRLKDKDKRRSTYYRFYTGQKWGQVQSYDMTLNSGKLGIEKCAELICTILP